MTVLPTRVFQKNSGLMCVSHTSPTARGLANQVGKDAQDNKESSGNGVGNSRRSFVSVRIVNRAEVRTKLRVAAVANNEFLVS